MKESFKKYWIYCLAFIFFILGMFYYSKAYAYDHYAYDCEESAYCFQHPLAIKHMDMYVETNHHPDSGLILLGLHTRFTLSPASSAACGSNPCASIS